MFIVTVSFASVALQDDNPYILTVLAPAPPLVSSASLEAISCVLACVGATHIKDDPPVASPPLQISAVVPASISMFFPYLLIVLTPVMFPLAASRP